MAAVQLPRPEASRARPSTSSRNRAAEHAYAVQQARTAWLTASRDNERDRWNELYDLVVPRPWPEAAEAERSAA